MKNTEYCKTRTGCEGLPNNLRLYRLQANISQDKLAEAVAQGAQSGVTVAISIAGSVCLWTGVGKLMEKAGFKQTDLLMRYPGVDINPAEK